MRLIRIHWKEINRVLGKKMYIADAISRDQPRDQMFYSTMYDNEMIARVGSVISSLPGSDTILQEIMESQEEDPVCSQRSK